MYVGMCCTYIQSLVGDDYRCYRVEGITLLFKEQWLNGTGRQSEVRREHFPWMWNDHWQNVICNAYLYPCGFISAQTNNTAQLTSKGENSFINCTYIVGTDTCVQSWDSVGLLLYTTTNSAPTWNWVVSFSSCSVLAAFSSLASARAACRVVIWLLSPSAVA